LQVAFRPAKESGTVKDRPQPVQVKTIIFPRPLSLVTCHLSSEARNPKLEIRKKFKTQKKSEIQKADKTKKANSHLAAI
jgi:hypothetical protein